MSSAADSSRNLPAVVSPWRKPLVIATKVFVGAVLVAVCGFGFVQCVKQAAAANEAQVILQQANANAWNQRCLTAGHNQFDCIQAGRVLPDYEKNRIRYGEVQ